MKALAAIFSVLGLVYLTAVALVALWNRWQSSRPEKWKGPSFKDAEHFYLTRFWRTKIQNVEPPRAEQETQPEAPAAVPTEPAKPKLRQWTRRRPERIRDMVKDLGKELGF